MTLTIADISWGINRKDGSYAENEVARETFEITKVGPLPPVGVTKKVFEILNIDENSVTIHLGGKAADIVLAKGESFMYRPISFDGGHKFLLELR